ncbi:unnamed protein product [Toxocara canis]|uniref:SH2 domain-containing protein n=1 Tax=Toxocara canis TaxID=6265 RepID=A0A183UX97_TOXCA|nr:unnamed protein product [Toxocara canis]
MCQLIRATMHTRTYRLVVASILYSEQDKRAVKYNDDEHNAIVCNIDHSVSFSNSPSARLRFHREQTKLIKRFSNGFIFVKIRNESAHYRERNDERGFHTEHCLDANPPDNYVLDLGESTNRILTVCRVEDEGSWRTVSSSNDTPSENPVPNHRIRKSSSFLKRLRRNRSGTTYQISLSNCHLNAWNQHSLPNVVPNTVITFRIMRDFEDVPCHEEVVRSEQIANDLYELTERILYTDAEVQSEGYQLREYDGDLGDAGDAILDHSFKFAGLPYIYKRIMILAVLLEWDHEDILLNERVIPAAITHLRTSSYSKADLCILAVCCFTFIVLCDLVQ